MINIYVVREAGGTDREILADQDFVQKYYPGKWILIGPYSEPKNPDPPPIITKLAMIDRFSDAEYIGILSAAKNDVEVQAWLDRFNVSKNINLEDSRTKSGLDLLVSKSLLIQARADFILNDPVQNNERET